MKEYFKPTIRKILGVIILLLVLSFVNFFTSYISNPSGFIFGQTTILIGFPLTFYSIGGTEPINILNLVIDIIIFYLIMCVLAIIFKRRKENVPNSNSGGGNTSPSNQTQP